MPCNSEWYGIQIETVQTSNMRISCHGCVSRVSRTITADTAVARIIRAKALSIERSLKYLTCAAL